jgi:hypothetical protein
MEWRRTPQNVTEPQSTTYVTSKAFLIALPIILENGASIFVRFFTNFFRICSNFLPRICSNFFPEFVRFFSEFVRFFPEFCTNWNIILSSPDPDWQEGHTQSRVDLAKKKEGERRSSLRPVDAPPIRHYHRHRYICMVLFSFCQIQSAKRQKVEIQIEDRHSLFPYPTLT